MDPVTAVILAAGEGKRMRSRQPKVLHPLCGRPLIAFPLRTARTLADRIVLVVGPNAEEVVAVAGGKSSSWRGAVLIAGYIGAAILFYKAGAR